MNTLLFIVSLRSLDVFQRPVFSLSTGYFYVSFSVCLVYRKYHLVIYIFQFVALTLTSILSEFVSSYVFVMFIVNPTLLRQV